MIMLIAPKLHTIRLFDEGRDPAAFPANPETRCARQASEKCSRSAIRSALQPQTRCRSPQDTPHSLCSIPVQPYRSERRWTS
jgi:hypothetical protein